MNRIRIILLVLAVCAPSLASAQQALKFEEAATLLGGSCGKDIDDNCRGVNFDPTRLKECLYRNQDVVSAKCQADYPRALSAITQRITARSTLMKLCNWEMNHLCSEVRADPAKGLQCLLDSTKKATGNCNKAISAAGYR
ncbi:MULTISPECIES: hypothetical protein [Bradyrhizobium]|jgi:hypothetical protein|uniref:Cysteine rich repeat-containing protein n=2 Tax=Bradyrhizobium TaxID=374 RepID=A0ABY0Q1F5_9BRAD|nr:MULTISPECIES: hypothetical protein [Bradyrhizobium]SDJ33517.1 hypothetical protein SAMN05444163_5155 [Bradyrhizobium ottawaense]SEC67721.1 hypothetical protein SAMN05444171_2007 [Bradyrhizobium lablabi]SHK82795.1 hypothetical protein SAMN05444321_0833 [Bradyrhizobium lablabi]